MQNKAESQESQILQHLQKGHRLTPIQALEKFGCLRLGARIWNLIHKRGHNIASEPVVDAKTGKRYACYFIPGLKPAKKERSLRGKSVSDFSKAILQPQVSSNIQQTLF